MPKNFNIGAYRERVFNNLPFLLNESARIVKQTIESDTDKGIDVNGDRFKPLKTATIKAKRRKGSPHPTKPLIDKGVMKVTYIGKRATKAKPEASLIMPKESDVYGPLHNEGGYVAGQPPQREWFGISNNANTAIDKFINRWLRELA